MKYITQLEKQKQILNEYFDMKAIYAKRYRKGGWTGKEMLIHIKDSETVFYDRLRRMISENVPILWYFEQDQWATHLKYKKQDILLAKHVFLATRNSVIEAVNMHLQTSAAKQGIHSRRGLMTMKQHIEFLLWHTEKHIGHLKKIKTVR
jgi:hypothetical protein